MIVNKKGLDLIRHFEGLRLTAYKCPANVWTIGYGWTIGVKKGDVWTKEKAEEMLEKGVEPYENAVEAGLKGAKTTSNQFSAMVCLAYNIGQGNFAKSSVLRFHRLGDYKNAADAFLMWNKANGVVLNGLVARRKAERELYLES